LDDVIGGKSSIVSIVRAADEIANRVQIFTRKGAGTHAFGQSAQPNSVPADAAADLRYPKKTLFTCALDKE
jgi:hypothetical protein